MRSPLMQNDQVLFRELISMLFFTYFYRKANYYELNFTFTNNYYFNIC